MNKSAKIISVFMYALSLILLLAYLIFDIRIVLEPYTRLIILIVSSALIYFSGLLLSKTVLKEKSEKLMKVTFSVIFILYLMLLVTLVLFDSYFGRTGISNIPKWSREAFKEYFESSVNLIPFETISSFLAGALVKNVSLKAFAVNIIGNLAAFAPFAFFLPVLFDKMRSLKNFLIAMIIIVLTAEIFQMILLTGAADIDDLILNVLGAMVAFGLLKTKYVDKIIKAITHT